jgi:methyl-accepting chemotaxis protein
MFRNLSLRTKVIALAGVGGLALGVLVAVASHLNRRAAEEAADECRELASAALDDNVRGLVNLCATHQEGREQALEVALNVADRLVRGAGGLRVAREGSLVDWTAVNEVTGRSVPVALPRMLLGSSWLGVNRDPSAPSPVVDEVARLTGETCTLFQRMNDDGDMLRVVTAVRNPDGARAIGTFLPRANPDGSANPAVAAVLKGDTYRGRTVVGNAWYLTAYQPVTDAAGRVTGLVSVGVRQEGAPGLRTAILGVQVGNQGRAFVLDGKGTYVVSPDGEQDGVNALEERDADDRLSMRDLWARAAELTPGEIAEHRFSTKSTDGQPSRDVRLRFASFKPWDWVVGVRVVEEEYQQAPQRLRESARHGRQLLGQAGGALALLTLAPALVLGQSLVRRLRRTRGVLDAAAAGDLSGRAELSSRDEVGQLAAAVNRAVEAARAGLESATHSARFVAGASEQVSAANRQARSSAEAAATQADAASAGAGRAGAGAQALAAGAEQMHADIREVARSARTAVQAAARALRVAEEAGVTVARLGQSSAEVGVAIKVLTAVAQQASVLALNGSIEAARAGAAGKGFAVVVNEVREMARETAKATEDVSRRIEVAQRDARGAFDAVGQVGAALNQIHEIQNGAATAAEAQAEAAGTFSRNVAEAARSSAELARDAAAVARAAQDSSASAGQAQNAAADLARAAQELQQLIGRLEQEGSEPSAEPVRPSSRVADGAPAPNGRAGSVTHA